MTQGKIKVGRNRSEMIKIDVLTCPWKASHVICPGPTLEQSNTKYQRITERMDKSAL